MKKIQTDKEFQQAIEEAKQRMENTSEEESDNDSFEMMNGDADLLFDGMVEDVNLVDEKGEQEVEKRTEEQ